MMVETANPSGVRIRPAVAGDADVIAGIFLESAEHHASLDPELYLTPARETIAARYREGRQHPADGGGANITLVAELGDELVGFIDARLYRPLDAMHREMLFCLVSEIAVKRRHQSHGIGRQLMRAAEEWGRQQGAESAILEYHSANTIASSFYRSMGYRITSITGIKGLG